MSHKRVLVLSIINLVLLVCLVYLIPVGWIPAGLQQDYFEIFGEPVYRAAPESLPASMLESEETCPPINRNWRKEHQIEGIRIQESGLCRPDDPDEIAAFVKGTNNVSTSTLMSTQLAPDAVVKENDIDNDGDPDDIHIRLEVTELNGHSPDVDEFIPAYSIAPGIRPGFWVFAPKQRGMATVNFESIQANDMLRMPSPVIRVEQGDRLRVTLENTHYMPHTIHFHGVDHPFQDAQGEGNDGVPKISEMMIMPGESRTYDMTPRHPGTMFYHCHVQPQVHILMGLQGMFVVEENRPNNPVQTFNVGAGHVRYPSAAVREKYSREYDLQYSEADRELHELIQHSSDPRTIARATNREYNSTQRVPEYFLLNGRSFPYTIRESLVLARPDEKIKLRVLNAGAEGVSLHTHGHKVTITHYDGVEQNPRARVTRDVVWLSAAQRLDLELNTVNDGLHSYGEGVWFLHDHREQAVTTDGMNPGGDISMIVYEKFLGENGIPVTAGDLSLFFTQEYYRRQVPVWSDMDPEGRFSDPAGQTGIPGRTILFIIAAGLFLAVTVLLIRSLKKNET
ncbi:MAG: multicopper oxidase domain-containing protein [Gammaproteobacteria bacterium]|nr:multicopper oxidase domain-containing protein [Gammaproteobacteria bacterium]